MIIRKFLKTIQVEEIRSSQVLRHFKTKERSKTAKFTPRLLPHAPPHMSQAPLHTRQPPGLPHASLNVTSCAPAHGCGKKAYFACFPS